MGLFQYNQKVPSSFNHRPEVYSEILIALGPALELDFGCNSYAQYVWYPTLWRVHSSYIYVFINGDLLTNDIPGLGGYFNHFIRSSIMFLTLIFLENMYKRFYPLWFWWRILRSFSWWLFFWILYCFFSLSSYGWKHDR